MQVKADLCWWKCEHHPFCNKPFAESFPTLNMPMVSVGTEIRIQTLSWTTYFQWTRVSFNTIKKKKGEVFTIFNSGHFCCNVTEHRPFPMMIFALFSRKCANLTTHPPFSLSQLFPIAGRHHWPLTTSWMASPLMKAWLPARLLLDTSRKYKTAKSALNRQLSQCAFCFLNDSLTQRG